MKTRKLGKSDLNLSIIGLGTWAIGGEWAYGWGPQDDQQSIDSILEALELGINWIDTAPAYGIGHAEVIVGKALKTWQKSSGNTPIIATKCGLVGNPDRSVTPRLTRESIITECEASLKRLGREQIDLYQIHWPNPPGEIGEAFQTLLELKKQGKIRYAGVSNFSRSQLEHISQYGELVSLQPPYSMVNRGIEEDIVDWCESNNVGIIPYSPLQTGLLTGKVSKEWIDKLPDSDWRKTKADFFKEPKLSRSLTLIERIKSTGLGKSHPLSEIAIQWILNRPGITSAICGARKPGQITEVVRALEWQITEEQITLLDTIYNEEFLK